MKSGGLLLASGDTIASVHSENKANMETQLSSVGIKQTLAEAPPVVDELIIHI